MNGNKYEGSFWWANPVPEIQVNDFQFCSGP